MEAPRNGANKQQLRDESQSVRVTSAEGVADGAMMTMMIIRTMMMTEDIFGLVFSGYQRRSRLEKRS